MPANHDHARRRRCLPCGREQLIAANRDRQPSPAEDQRVERGNESRCRATARGAAAVAGVRYVRASRGAERARSTRAVWSGVTLVMLGCSGGAATGAAPAREPVVPIPRVVTYRPFVGSYRAATRRDVEQEFNGQRTTTQVLLHYYVSTALVETPSGLRVTLTIDSVPVLSGLPATEAEAVEGATFTAALSPTGELRDFHGSEREAELLRQISLGLQEFFPRLPSGGAQPGQHWSDTAETGAGARDLKLTIRSLNEHEVIGWTEFGGEQSLHIRTASTYKLRGTGFEAGQEYLLEGGGVAYADQYLSRDGRYLGSISTDTLHSSASLPAMGATIPIVQTRTDTLTIIR